MKTFRLVAWLVMAMVVGQSCVTTPSKRSVVKKKKFIAPTTESYALMEEWDRVDPQVLKRGNKARGLSEY